MICTTCNCTVHEQDAVYSRSAWWHKLCATFVGDVVAFPSEGKLRPTTILEAK